MSEGHCMTDVVPMDGPADEKPEGQKALPDVDRELVAKAQGGDDGAFDQLIEKYKARVYAVIYHMLGNNEDAADLTQEVFVKAFKAISSFRSQSNFYTWLNRIAVNTTINFIRLRKEEHLSLDEFSSEVEGDPSFQTLVSKETADRDVDRDELQKKLNEALQKLSKEHRAVVVLHDIEGLRHHEIAKVLGCSEATARSRLFYAHQELQALLANYL
jgi:RNA polymerase sigma-70 factor (ECF subfamily)